jgi:hypothetical protein
MSNEKARDDSITLPVVKPLSEYFISRKKCGYKYEETPLLLSLESAELVSQCWKDDENSKLLNVTEGFDRVPVSDAALVPWDDVSTATQKSPRECFRQYYNVCSSSLNFNKDWEVEEEKKLLQLASQHNYHNWHIIAYELGTNRSPFGCLKHYQQTLNSDLVLSEEWSKEEDDSLKEAVEECGVGNWQAVSSYLPGRTAPQCLNRWRKSFHQQQSVSGAWLDQEERALFLAAYAFNVPMLNDTKRTPEELVTVLSESYVSLCSSFFIFLGGNFVSTIEDSTNIPTPNWINIAKFVPGKYVVFFHFFLFDLMFLFQERCSVSREMD